MIIETIPALGALTVDQKLRLVWELWQDVSHDGSITPEIECILDERLAEHASEPANVRTTEEVSAGIQALKKRLTASRS